MKKGGTAGWLAGSSCVSVALVVQAHSYPGLPAAPLTRLPFPATLRDPKGPAFPEKPLLGFQEEVEQVSGNHKPIELQ
jgi:hypothetical protein